MIVKHTIIILFLLIAYCTQVNAQNSKPGSDYLLRIYEDNDCYNSLVKTTDCSYSNGTQIHIFYTKERPTNFFGFPVKRYNDENYIKVYGWGLSQIMFTPRDIYATGFQPDDYPYAGALFVSHSVYSYHPAKKYDLQTTISLGVRGPAAFAAELQRFIHHVVGNKKALGWDHQLGNKLYANLGIKAEKGLLVYDNLEVMATAQVLMGTMDNGIGLGSLIRVGKMTPYFNGFLTNFKAGANKENIQIYLVIKPEIQYSFHYGLLTGELEVHDGTKINYTRSKPKFNHSIDLGVVAVYKNWAFSYTQNTSGPYLPGLYNHNIGNFSFYFSW